MSIQGLLNTQPAAERRRAAAGQARTAGASFQDRLAQTTSAAAAGAVPQLPASSADSRRAPAFEQASPAERDNPLAALNAARLLLLQRTKEGKEWKKEQEEWDRLMKCLDNWIEALREKADREREGRSGDITAEGGEALMALYRGYIATAWTEAADDPAQAKEDLLSALTAAQSDLLERLKEDRADEEERQEWEDLMKRLDRWIESLRAERRDEDKRAYGASAIGVQTGADAGK